MESLGYRLTAFARSHDAADIITKRRMRSHIVNSSQRLAARPASDQQSDNPVHKDKCHHRQHCLRDRHRRIRLERATIIVS
jgi:hypothetical protein